VNTSPSWIGGVLRRAEVARQDSCVLKANVGVAAVRGLCLGRRLLAELERRAAEHGCRAVRLETNRSLVEAIAMYRSSGYREVAAFNDEPYGDHCFEKPISGAAAKQSRL
jgi:GNAT superfamily N-acetyltransferase